ncbi:MAG: aminoacetone oxidase family FAD-binding enzyme [Bacteroidales bacterium]|nr:aminoacetone oxidase family FAD-binding enzyme [Bacteroidales bacterium]
MKYDIIVIGGGASGLMAAWSAARKSPGARVCVLEKMPKPARKIMITGKGRCNFTNLKDWNAFSAHIRSGSQFVRPAWRSFPPERVIDFFESAGMPTVVERGDRAFPSSHRASDVVDTLVRECLGAGVKIETDAEVVSVTAGNVRTVTTDAAGTAADGIGPYELSSAAVPAASGKQSSFEVHLSDGTIHKCSRLIIATGGLSYPGTGSTGDGLKWAEELGHNITPTFPSLTALVPSGYKEKAAAASLPHHIPRETPLTETGRKFCGISLKNIGARLMVEDTLAGEEFGDIDFTDGGIEGPVGFQLSRKAVKSMINGSRTVLHLDLKPGVSLTELTGRIKELWEEIGRDPRSARIREKERCRILLGKLMPWELIPAFTATHPGIITLERRGRTDTKVWINLVSIAKGLKDWEFKLDGFVGWERAVVTAGGVSTDDVISKTLESRIVPGLYFCGEALDIDADTGGYNLQLAFCTGFLAGQSAAKS